MATQAYHKRDLYRDVTDRILAELEAGAPPWIKPWSATPGMNNPVNAATCRQLLRSDSRAFFTAASRAQAAADYLRGLALAHTEIVSAEAA